MTRKLQSQKLRCQWTVWWVLFVASFFATAPTLSHAFSSLRHGTQGTVEICTSKGAKVIALDDGSPNQSTQHCQFCLHQGDRVAPPSTHPFHLHWEDVDQYLIPFYQAPYFSHTALLGVRPRGPPSELEV